MSRAEAAGDPAGGGGVAEEPEVGEARCHPEVPALGAAALRERFRVGVRTWCAAAEGAWSSGGGRGTARGPGESVAPRSLASPVQVPGRGGVFGSVTRRTPSPRVGG